MNPQRGMARQYWVAVRVLLIFTVALGLVYPLVITGVGLLVPAQANGSLVFVDGRPIGSSLIGQSFTDDDGEALPDWFQSRPSAVDYDAGRSGGSNLGPENEALEATIEDAPGGPQRPRRRGSARDPARRAHGIRLRTRSADQPRVRSGCRSNGWLPPAGSRSRMSHPSSNRSCSERALGFLGERTVNVLELNIALARMDAND